MAGRPAITAGLCFSRRFDAGIDGTIAQPGPGTIGFGLNVPAGAGHFRVLQIVRASNGACVAVDEADIAAELARVWEQTHRRISPEGAACLAALPQLLDRGLLTSGERVVVVNTGSAEKRKTGARDERSARA